MKDLVILWDPENPLVSVAPVVDALKNNPELQIRTLTFDEIGHQTLPNRAFKLQSVVGGLRPDGILWIEGGPLPSNLKDFDCPKACWLLNTHLEPSLLKDVGATFDYVFTASLRDTSEERAQWLPPATYEGNPSSPPAGISLLVDDPMPPIHAETEQALLTEFGSTPGNATPVVIALGNSGQIHPMALECVRSGAAVVVDPGCDLRGIAHVGEHLEVYPSRESLTKFVRELLRDPQRLSRLATRGPAITSHLHQPGMRADRIVQTFWPRHRVLSGKDHSSRISVLVTCYRYLKRFKFCLESLARQHLPPGSLEIVVADPGSPDGLAAFLEDFSGRNPQVRLVHLPLDPTYHRNRGVGINRAFDVSAGQVVIGIDGDLVFPPGLVGLLAERVANSPDKVFGVRRSFVSRDETEQILSGALDPLVEFERLSQSRGDGEEKPFVGVLGYCQAVHRSAFSRARYPEEFDMVNQSDIVFVERLAREAQVSSQYLGDQTVLHLWHPRNWMGTSESL